MTLQIKYWIVLCSFFVTATASAQDESQIQIVTEPTQIVTEPTEVYAEPQEAPTEVVSEPAEVYVEPDATTAVEDLSEDALPPQDSQQPSDSSAETLSAENASLQNRLDAVESYLVDLQTYLQEKEAEIQKLKETQPQEEAEEAAPQQEEEKKKDKEPDFVTLMIRGNLGSYYKLQTSYHTPLDSDGAIDRHGANNRSKQRARTKAEVGFIALGDKQDYQGTPWYKYIGVAFWSVDVADPDHPDTTDGQRRGRFENKDVWFRYSPHIAIGFKIGSQTIKATANPANNYIFEGDYDQDFIFYAASTLLEVPGFSVDLHLGKSIELGFGVLEGVGDGSLIASGAAGQRSAGQSIVAWTAMEWSWISLQAAFQSVKIGGTEEKFDPEITHFAQEFGHTIINAAVRLSFWDGKVGPYFGYQRLSGDKAEIPFANEDLQTLNELLNLGIAEEARAMRLSATSVGWVSDFGKIEVAFDYTQVSTPAFNEEGSVNAAIGVKSAFQSNLAMDLGKGTKAFLFFHSLSSKRDEAREFAEEQARANQDALNQFGDIVDVDNLGEDVVNALEAFEWTGSNSFGIGFKMKFGNSVF